MKHLWLILFAVVLMGQRDPLLVPEVSQHKVEVRQGFTGTELLLFGAILDPAGHAAGNDYDIIVVLKGPAQPVRLREKERFLGIWVNAASTDMRSVPTFFSVASSRPIDQVVDAKTAAIYEFGTRQIQLSPSGVIDPDEQARFSAGLVDLKTRQGLYQQAEGGVTISNNVLYQARIKLPSNVVTGTYTAETFAINRGHVIASALAEVEVEKVGFERVVADGAANWSLAYGLLAVIMSVGMGYLAGRLFAMI